MTVFHPKRLTALVLLGLALVGCDQGRQTPPKTTVHVLNAAPGFPELSFRREQVRGETLQFRQSTQANYDEDTYDFYIDEPSLTADRGRTWTFVKEVLGGTGYDFVLTQVGGEVNPVVLEYTPLGASATGVQVVGLHAAEGFPAMDLYLEPPGANIAAATPLASLSFLDPLPAQSIAAGDYEITLTERANPGNVLFASAAVTLPAAVTAALVIEAEGGSGTADLSVALTGPLGSTVIYDRNATAGLRIINAAADTLPRNVAINEQFSPPLFSAVPYAIPTDYAAVPVGGSQPIAVTPADNIGALEIDQLFGTNANELLTMMITGDAGALKYLFTSDDRRRFAKIAKLRVYNAASQFATYTDFVLVPQGEDPTGVYPWSVLIAPDASALSPVAPGSYDLVLRQNGTNTILAGPLTLTLEGGGIYGVLAVNGPDAATASLVLFDDFTP